MSQIVLKYIKLVEVIDAGLLSLSVLGSKGVKLEESLPFETLCTVGLSKLEISDELEAKNRIYVHSLEAVMQERLTVANRKLCFRLTAVDGSQYLIGVCGRPYPIVAQSMSFPAEITGSCAVKMSVTWRYVAFYPVL